ncbi:MAG: hypothetical protein NTV99_04245, partial [Deltaproteobacteria bacterium]|nr:hypothetical protein [Deltaproteobacteria bacterium]
ARSANCLSPEGESLRPQRSKHRRLLKNDPLLRCPCPSSFNVRSQYASLLRTSGALHPALFEQPVKEPERSPGAHPVRRRNHDGHFLTGEQPQVATKTVYSQEESCSSAFGQQPVKNKKGPCEMSQGPKEKEV